MLISIAVISAVKANAVRQYTKRAIIGTSIDNWVPRGSCDALTIHLLCTQLNSTPIVEHAIYFTSLVYKAPTNVCSPCSSIETYGGCELTNRTMEYIESQCSQLVGLVITTESYAEHKDLLFPFWYSFGQDYGELIATANHNGHFSNGQVLLTQRNTLKAESWDCRVNADGISEAQSNICVRL